MAAGRTKVVVIDDDATDRMLLARALAEGWPDAVLVEAENGEEGIRLVRSEAPDIVLVDLRMPGLDGFAVLRWLRFEAIAQSFRVAVLTTSQETIDQRRSQELNADLFFSKPTQLAGYRCLVEDLRRIFAVDGGIGGLTNGAASR